MSRAPLLRPLYGGHVVNHMMYLVVTVLQSDFVMNFGFICSPSFPRVD